MIHACFMFYGCVCELLQLLRRRPTTQTYTDRNSRRERGGGGVGVGGKRENEMSRDGMGLDETDRSVRPAFVSLICQVSLVCVRSICHASVGY